MIIGVTGIIGSGKSTAADLLAKRFNARIIGVDAVGHEVLAQNKFVRFGVRCFFGSLDRKDIARQVFSSRRKLVLLNMLLHPFMRQCIKQQLRETEDNLILDAALLFPLRLFRYCDQVVFVTAHKALIYKRLAAKGYSSSQIKQRLIANRGVYKYQKKAVLLPNNGSLARLKEAVLGLQF